MLSIRLPSEIESRLANLAEFTGRTKTYYVREAIVEHLDQLEELYIAEQRLLDIKSGKNTTVTLEELLDEYNLAR